MTDNAERWRNVAQAAQWLAEGREVEYRSWSGLKWNLHPAYDRLIGTDFEYRLKPEPPKPREFQVGWNQTAGRWEIMSAPWHDSRFPTPGFLRVREVIE